MEIEIYADIFFLVNFLMDLLIFWAASKFLRWGIGFHKIFLGAFIVSFLYCISIFTSHYNICLAFLFLIVGLMITFRPRNFFLLLKIILLIHAISFVIGGMTLALFFYIDFSSFLPIPFRLENFSFKILLISTLVFFICIKLFVSYIRAHIFSKQIFYNVNIFVAGKKSEFNALVDTGNSLCDHISGLPIIIVELSAIKNIFPRYLQLAISQKNFERLCLSNFKFNFIPFKSVGNENGILICFQPDYVKIFAQNQITLTNIFIGICDFKLSDSFQALISPDLLL